VSGQHADTSPGMKLSPGMGSGITLATQPGTPAAFPLPGDFRTVDLPPETQEVLDHLFSNGLGGCDRKAQEVVENAVRLAYVERQATVTTLARTFYMSRRALGRLCKSSQIPTPSHLLVFGRLLRSTVAIQDGVGVDEGCRANFDDMSTFSCAMKNATGLRPRQLRLQGGGWITLAHKWMEAESAAGRLAFTHPPEQSCPACGGKL